MSLIYRIHVSIDQENNPPPPAGPPNFANGGSIKPGQFGFAEIYTYQEDKKTPEPNVLCQGWLLGYNGDRISEITNCRTNEEGEIEVYFWIPSSITTAGMCSFIARRSNPWHADAITIPVVVK